MNTDYFISKNRHNDILLIETEDIYDDNGVKKARDTIYSLRCYYSTVSDEPQLSFSMTDSLADVSMVRSRYYNEKKGLKFYKFTEKSMCKIIEIMKSLRKITYTAIQNAPEVHLEKGKCYKNFSDERIEIIKKVSNCRCKAVIIPLNELKIQSHNQPQFLLDENWIMVDESSFERINESLRSVLLEVHKGLSDIYVMFKK